MATWKAAAFSSLKSALPHTVRHWARQIVPVPPRPEAVYPFDVLSQDKRDAIDYAVTHCGVQSFADLGGVWNVDAGYTFYAMERHGLQNGTIVDFQFTPAVTKWGERYPSLRTVQGNFAFRSVAQRVGAVDAVFLFDVLLHQVNPDWDAVLSLYAPQVKCFVILNQQFDAKTTFRLLDRGKSEYFQHVPHTTEEVPDYRMAFEQPDAIHPVLGCKYRDNPSIWQWGITDDDLIAKMKSIGFTLHYFKNCNAWAMPHVQNRAFVFRRSVEPKY